MWAETLLDAIKESVAGFGHSGDSGQAVDHLSGPMDGLPPTVDADIHSHLSRPLRNIQHIDEEALERPCVARACLSGSSSQSAKGYRCIILVLSSVSEWVSRVPRGIRHPHPSLQFL